MTTWPATCPRCNAAVVDTLWSDPTVPLYACGSLPYGTHLGTTQGDLSIPGPHVMAYADDAVQNVTIPTGAELAEYATIVGLATIAWTQDPVTLGGRIGLCEVMHCEATAVDGRCIDHDPAIRAASVG